MADFVYDETGDFDPRRVTRGSILFVSAYRLREFESKVLQDLREPFVLISHQGDTKIDYSYSAIADRPSLVHWFAQNALLEHPKVTPLPIGLEDQWRHNAGEKSDFRRLSKLHRRKTARIVVAFSLNTNPDSRFSCYRALWKKKCSVEFHSTLNNSLYRRRLQDYMFVASPPGNGLDCHRTWEAMYLGVVPLVEDNHMNRYFDSLGLPLVCVSDWKEVGNWTESYLIELYNGTMSKCHKEPLFFSYWRQKIEEYI
jgi:hypothetical protein